MCSWVKQSIPSRTHIGFLLGVCDGLEEGRRLGTGAVVGKFVGIEDTAFVGGNDGVEEGSKVG